MHTSMLVTWTAAMLSMGLLFGAIAPQIGDLLDSASAREMMQRLGGVGALQETLVVAELSLAAVIVSCFAIAVLGHAGSDEHDGRTEQVLATATSRAFAFVATAVVALAGATWLLLVTGLGLLIGYGAAGGSTVTNLVPAALTQAPAVWVMTALAALCFALRSAWTVAAWGLLVAFVTAGQVGELLRLPTWVVDLSPYTHVPGVPADELSWRPELVLTLVAMVLLGAAAASYRRRDIA